MNTCHPYIEDIEALTSHIESWKDLQPDQMKFERLGGLSNRIWKVSSLVSSTYPQAVIFRKFNHSQIVDRQKENHILRELAKAGVGGQFYAGTDEYRIEKYYDHTEIVSSDINTLPTRRHLAKSLSELHGVELNGLDRKPVFLKVLEEQEIIKMAKEKARKTELFTPEEKHLLEEIMSLKEEISFLSEILPRNADSVVFSHNDLHSANMLRLLKNDRLLLIDYEYSDYNFRGYDIANVFNETQFVYGHTEHPYYHVDEKRFPGEEDLIDFITYYLLFSKFHHDITQADGEAMMNDKKLLVQYIENNFSPEEFDKEIQQILSEVRANMLFSHFYWTFWSVIMSKNPDITFDYLAYAHSRYEMYVRDKKMYFGSAGRKNASHSAKKNVKNIKKTTAPISQSQSCC